MLRRDMKTKIYDVRYRSGTAVDYVGVVTSVYATDVLDALSQLLQEDSTIHIRDVYCLREYKDQTV